MKFTSPLGDIQQAGTPGTPAKSLLFVLLLVCDCKHLDTSLYFIITNLHTELKPQVNASHDMNSLAFGLVTEAPP